jgi:predicted Fe-Mo cluster-binding NifX family protein
MKVAIATEDGEVAQHFGRCECYTVAQIEGEQITSREVVQNPGHEPGYLPGYLAERGVTCIVAGGMGPRAEMLFAQHQIQTITGVTGPVEEALGALLRGELEGGESLCDH